MPACVISAGSRAADNIEHPKIARIRGLEERALKATHEQGIIHRDLKPDNIKNLASHSGRGEANRLAVGRRAVCLRAGARTVFIATPLDEHAARYNPAVDASLEQRIADVFSPRSDVMAVYLFGSTARGTARVGSDIDVAVLFDSPPPRALGGPRMVIEGELEQALGRPVDLVVLNNAPVDLRARVLRDGRLLVERDPSARIVFEVRTRNEAFDLEPALTRYRGSRAAGMADPALMAKKLALIESCVSDLRRLAQPEALATDVREQRFVEHTLQLAIQAALDVASHIVSDRRLGEPRTNRELFDLLQRDAWIEDPLASTLRNMAGFRNVLVHGYDDVDLAVVRDVLGNHLSDLETFVEAVRRRLKADVNLES